jgi:hypothetical protein
LRIILQYVYGRLAEEPPFRNNPKYDEWLAQYGTPAQPEDASVNPEEAAQSEASSADA